MKSLLTLGCNAEQVYTGLHSTGLHKATKSYMSTWTTQPGFTGLQATQGYTRATEGWLQGYIQGHTWIHRVIYLQAQPSHRS